MLLLKMARQLRQTKPTRQSARQASARAKTEPPIKQEEPPSPPPAPPPPPKRQPPSPTSPPPLKRPKLEPDDEKNPASPKTKPAINPTAATTLQSRKLKSYTQHGARARPATVAAAASGSRSRAGCGASPSVLDALVRTILSQNTTDTNSSRAHRAMDRAYGPDPSPAAARWSAILSGGPAKLEDTIRSGGLSRVKSRVIIDILTQVRARHGQFSLDHLLDAGSDEAMAELLSFKGVGPKTASCVLLFCLGRESFAVDTHVWRISGLLGWRPEGASRDETHLHLDARVPGEDKYGLHVLMVTHGKRCAECRAGGKDAGACELRRAFRREVVEGGKLEGE